MKEGEKQKKTIWEKFEMRKGGKHKEIREEQGQNKKIRRKEIKGRLP
jgi:hypothetical protein